jgi:hypothetical protein
MLASVHTQRSRFPLFLSTLFLVVVGLLLLLWTGCGADVQITSNPPLGRISVSISDPPVCRVPLGNFKNVYVTVRSVQAHISSTATDAMPGWEELAPQLAAQPMQIDLLASPAGGGCTLAQLGRNVGLPVGSYQQIRLILVSNNPAPGEPVPANNACGSQGLNCVVLSDNSIHRLELSSQANTGLKIPPGQIVGGPIRVTEGQHVDLNIDFNTCASIIRQGNGQFRLRPTLTAGQVSTVNTAISGQVVDTTTQQPVAGATVVVAVEQPDADGVDRVVMQTAADANGNFIFCPLPTGTYDVVAVAVSGNVAYGPTVLLNVPAGTAAGLIPVTPQTGASTAQGTLQGVVSSAGAAGGISIDAAMSALQSVALPGGATRPVTIPTLPGSTETVATVATPQNVVCPANTFCEQYTLNLPASNPSVGNFSMAGTTFAGPAAGDVLFTLDARAFATMSGGTPTCSPSRLTTDKDQADQPLKLAGGTSVTPKTLSFTGCS